MTAESLDHFNVFTDDLAGTIAFYTEIIGLKEGERPPFDFPGAWLYCGDQAVLHLVEDRPAGAETGPIDHVAFRAKGIAAMRARLSQHGVRFRESDVPEMPLRQIFVLDPNGVQIEMNFWNET